MIHRTSARSALRRSIVSVLASAMLIAGVGGCQLAPAHRAAPNAAVPGTLPRELCKTVLPPYVIEPPDILQIDVVRMSPRPPYRILSTDVLAILVQGALPNSPIAGNYVVEPGGVVNLGPDYGRVCVDGLTVEQAEAEVTKYLQRIVRDPKVSISLAATALRQQIAGEHLVGPDGTVTLGCYGSVSVVGQTLPQAKQTIEMYLSQYLDRPEVSLNVFAYNSKSYYVVTQGAGLGDGVYRFPVTGNETVLDAISQINGLGSVSSKNIWVARPTGVPGQMQTMRVCWDDIIAQADASTNYQLMPGDRLFIAEDSWVALDTQLAKITAPFERIMGFSLLGVGTVTRFSGPVLKGGGNANANF